MGRAVAVGGIETMRVGAHTVARELDSVASAFLRERLGGVQKRAANPLASPISAHVHALNFATPPSGMLEMLEYEHLTDAHHFSVKFANQDVAPASARLLHRGPVRIDVVGTLRLGPSGAANDDVHGLANVPVLNRSNADRHFSTCADLSELAHRLTLQPPAPRPDRGPHEKGCR